MNRIRVIASIANYDARFMVLGARRVGARRPPARLIVLVVVVSMVFLVPGRSSADDFQSRQGELRSQEAQLQQQLASAVASDAQVQHAVTRLDQIATAQRATAATAQTELAIAQNRVAQLDAQVATLTAQLDGTKAQVALARANLRELAISDYTQGANDTGTDTLFASNAERASVLTEYRSLAARNVNDAIDRLNRSESLLGAQRADLQVTQSQAATTLAEALTRAQAAAAASTEADQAAAVQTSAHAVLQRRIADFTSESANLAAAQQQIEALIAANPSASSASSRAGHNVGLVWPLHGIVTSEFGPRWGGFHPGIDIADPTGTPIHAAKAGQVIFAGVEGGYGNFVLIDHGDGIVTGYAHQSQIAVSQGQSVSQGELIGYVGSTGESTGPHLHFEVRVNGSPQNPRDYVPGAP